MSSPEPAAVLALSAVSKTFASRQQRSQALDRVSLTVPRGVVTGLVGPDGAGKTTLMRLCAGLLAPDEGGIQVLGLDATRDSLAVQASIGYMPQRFGLYEDLSVQENLDLYADLQGVPHAERETRYASLMHMTGLAPFTSRLAGRLSGGMKQKLGLACTLVRPPRLLLLDEPTVGVDPVSRRELWSIVYRLVQEEGMSVLLSTAYLDEAERCSEVVLLHQGRVLGSGTPAELSARMQGRVYRLRLPGSRARTLQAAVTGAPGVLDAVVAGGDVRLVMEDSTPPDPQGLLPEAHEATVDPLPPRFEDAFVTLIKAGAGTAPSQPAPAGASKDWTRGESMIRVQGLARRFGDFYAVRDLSFEVDRGEVFGLLGANGAGKTTTFRMLCGLLPASEGALSVAGVDLRSAPARARARIGYMSQKFSLYGNLSVCQNLRFFASTYGLGGRRRQARIDWALEHLELGPMADHESAALPLGYKQRLALACALMHEPDILFLDEPTSGVDPLARREFWGRINQLAEAGVTVLVTTHFMEEAEYCDRMAIMAAGTLLAMGTPAEIKAAARNPRQPAPSMEEAFIHLIEQAEQETAA